MTEAGLRHELRGHHHQCNMAVPGPPFPGLVLRHSAMTFGVLECSPDPEALRLHLCQFRNTRLSRSVTQTILQGAGGIHFPSYSQVPTPGIRAVFVPQPDLPVQYLNDQLSLSRASLRALRRAPRKPTSSRRIHAARQKWSVWHRAMLRPIRYRADRARSLGVIGRRCSVLVSGFPRSQPT
jgi:hypothetical protein